MFNIREKFKFLEDGIDFPFYNDMPKLSIGEWAILAIAVILFTAIIFIPWISQPYSFVIYFLLMIIPAIYVCKGDYGLFFKRPKLRNIITIILCAGGYIVYATFIALVLRFMGVPISGDSAMATGLNLAFIVGMLLQLVGEEFFKVFILLIVMYVVYRYTSNRSMALGLGIIVTLFVFGIAHMEAYGRILQVLLVQGLGTIFNLYAYMKTKNVIVSYIVHVIVDFYGYFAMLAFHVHM